MPQTKSRKPTNQLKKAVDTTSSYELRLLDSVAQVNVMDLNCAVCDATADGQHFGAEACRACAAFFRRTIARRLKYVCRFDDDCQIGIACRSLCRSCRLAKCYSVGMNNRAVRSQYTNTIVRPAARKTNHSSTNTSLPSANFQTDEAKTSSAQLNMRSFPSNLDKPSSSVSYTTNKLSLLVFPTLTYQTSSLSTDGSSASNFMCDRKSSPSTGAYQSDNNLIVVVDEGQKPEISFEIEQRKGAVPPNKKYLQDIVETNAQDYFVDIKALPSTHPVLTKMLIGFDNLQRRRDVSYSRTRECNGYNTRIFIERQVFDVHQYYKNVRMEIEWVAEMLSTFDGYSFLTNPDKVALFRNYWIRFIVLERSFDTYRVIGPSFADLRLVFANGDIFDVLNCSYEIQNVSNRDAAEINASSQPWFKRCVTEQLMPIKKLQPTEVEMIFTLGLMLWKLPSEVLAELSEKAVSTAEQMVEILYGELAAYYASELTSAEDQIKRVSELVYLIGNTEQIVLHRKEDIIMSGTSKTFEVDVYLEDIFETVSCPNGWQ